MTTMQLSTKKTDTMLAITVATFDVDVTVCLSKLPKLGRLAGKKEDDVAVCLVVTPVLVLVVVEVVFVVVVVDVVVVTVVVFVGCTSICTMPDSLYRPFTH